MKNKDKQSAIDLAKAYSGFLSENEGRRSLCTITVTGMPCTCI